jgi:ankyrin repeat protein
MGSTDGVSSKSPLMELPNELFIEVASHLKSFNDLNSLVRTSQFFHGMFNTDLYCRAVAADGAVLDDIVRWVLSRYRLASLTLLLDHGLSVNRTVKSGGGLFQETMLHFLGELRDRERSVPLVRLLIQRGADMEVKDAQSSKTVLHQAVAHNNCEMAALLLGHGADLNAVGHWGDTLLHTTSNTVTGKADMIHLLIAHGADIEARATSDDTPLIRSSIHRNPHVMAALLEHGADAGAHNEFGQTTLHWGSRWIDRQHHELAKSLLKHGANVNATDASGRKPLHWLVSSVEGDHLFMLRFLLENGADVNAITNNGLSVLQCALHGHFSADVVPLLLEYGADVSVLNRKERQLLSRISRRS